MPTIKPRLVSPVLGSPVDATSAHFLAEFRSTVADDEAGNFYLGRRRVDVLGTDEWYVGGVWTETKPGAPNLATIADVLDGTVVDLVPLGVGGWVPGAVYQWWIEWRSVGSATAVASDRSFFTASTPTTMAFDAFGDLTNDATAFNETRPVLRWSVTGTQRAYELMAFAKEDYEADYLEIDPDDPSWAGIATWSSGTIYSTSGYSHRVGFDVGDGFLAFGRVMNKDGLWGPWTSREYDVAVDRPPPPTLSFETNPELGTVTVVVNSTFNMLDAESSAMADPDGVPSVGRWLRDVNVHIQPESGYLAMTAGGLTFAEADALYTTFTAQDTAQGTFLDQANAQASPVGVSRIKYGDEAQFATQFIPVVPGQPYSAIAGVNLRNGASADAWITIEFFNAAGALISSMDGAATHVVVDSWFDISSGPKTAPALSAWARLKISVELTHPGGKAWIDKVALSRGEEVFWTPGGLNASLLYTVSRKVGDAPWEYLWDATYQNPTTAPSGALTVAQVVDRSYPIGKGEPVLYRGVVHTVSQGRRVSSSLQEEVGPELFSEAWFLRCYTGELPDVRLRAESFSFSYVHSNDVHAADGATHSQVIGTGAAPGRPISCEAFLFDETEYERAKELLQSDHLLYVQRNIGDGFYFRATGSVRFTQKRATGGVVHARQPRHFHQVSFSGEVVSPPKDLYL